VCQQRFQANKPDGGIDFANLVTSDDGSMPIDMTPDRELEPMAESKNAGYWRSDEDFSL
jgi:hypothetical protein